MATISILSTGLVFRGQEDAPHLRNAYFPTVAELADGTLVAAMDIGQKMEALDLRSFSCRSKDGGQTWSTPAKIFEPDTSRFPSTTTCRISRTHDNKLVGIACSVPRTRGGEVPVNPETDGFLDETLIIVRSNDGVTWTAPQVINPPLNWPVMEVAATILPLNKDRWLWPTSLFLNWEGHSPTDIKAYVAISRDQGTTWDRTTDVFNFWSRKTFAWEQKMTRLSDGRLLNICWCYNSQTKQHEVNRYAISGDQGDSYSAPRDTPLHGQTCTVLGLEDNHVLAVYRRTDKRGLWGHLAKIEGERWTPVADLAIWGSDVSALADGKSSDLRNLHELRFGFPTLIRLKNGDVFCVFWGLEDGLTVIRWYRLKVML